MNKPLICTLSLTDGINKNLKTCGFNIYEGSIGTQVKTENTGSYDHKFCLLNHDFPSNIHEYAVFIIDLTNATTIAYNKSNHERIINKSGSDIYFLSKHPQNIFDPRPYSLNILRELFDLNNECLIVVFCAENEDVNYDLVRRIGNSYEQIEADIYSNYSFLSHIPVLRNRNGYETEVPGEITRELRCFLEKYVQNLSYHVTFNHPTVYENGKLIFDPYFNPLFINKANEVVSFCDIRNKAKIRKRSHSS